MSTLALKILACAAMLADHLGFRSIFGDAGIEAYMRLFGRLAFPIFCYLIAIGYRKTSNKYFYLLRLFALGVISEMPYNYFVYGNICYSSHHNVFYTLSLGLAAIIVFELIVKISKSLTIPALIPVILAAYAAEYYKTDYGYAGVLLIFLFHISGEKKVASSIVCTLFASRFFISAFVSEIFNTIFRSYSFALPELNSWQIAQFCAAAAIIPILLFNGKKGYTPKSKAGRMALKYGFYFFYPAHLLIIGIIVHIFVY